MIPKLTLLLLSFSLILPAKNNSGFFKSPEEKANCVNQHGDCDEANNNFANFEKVTKKYESSEGKNHDNYKIPEVMRPVIDIWDGGTGSGSGSGGTALPNYYGFSRRDFLDNAKTYQPDNRLGTCGYVSLIQLMSFYDTFYNDNIIPDNYDRSNEKATSLSSAVANSPGVEPTKWADYPCDGGDLYIASKYREFCFDRMQFDFQSYLTILNNQNRGTDNDSEFKYSIGAWSYKAIFDKMYGDDEVIVSEYDDDYSQSELKQIIKDFISGGDPVVVHIRDESDPNKDNWRYHSVVAYECSGNTIYANFGWGSGSTHRDLFDTSSSKYKYKETFIIFKN